LKFIKEVSKRELSQNTINHYFRNEFAFELYVKEAKAQGKVIEGQLLTAGSDRRFHATVPSGVFKYQLLFSIGSLLEFVVGKLNIDQKVHLQQSLLYILDYYYNHISDPFDISDLSNLEKAAYLAGTSQIPQTSLKFG